LKLNIKDRFNKELPADPSLRNYRRQVEEACFSFVTPRVPSNPTLVHVSKEMLEEIGITEEQSKSDTFLNTFSGKEVIHGTSPYAMCYAGHQFGHIGGRSSDDYLQFFQEVVDRTLDMVLHWQRVGFVHGVMNTDNMSILGLTIDYGPYGWLEGYDPGWTPNTTDAKGKRYRYGNQPNMALWNLMQLANALYPLVGDIPALESILKSFQQSYPKNGCHACSTCTKNECCKYPLLEYLSMPYYN